MQNFITYAERHNITLLPEGPCQFCGAAVSGGVKQCHENTQHIADILDFNNPALYQTRFISVDAMALQHCELHGPWNNHIHLTRLCLIFEHAVQWDYSKTPQLSDIINAYKKNKTETLQPPPPKQRGNITTSDIIKAQTIDETIAIIHQWGKAVYDSFKEQHEVIVPIVKMWMERFG